MQRGGESKPASTVNRQTHEECKQSMEGAVLKVRAAKQHVQRKAKCLIIRGTSEVLETFYLPARGVRIGHAKRRDKSRLHSGRKVAEYQFS